MPTPDQAVPPIQVTDVELMLVDLPLHEPFVAGHGTTVTRTLSFVRLAGIVADQSGRSRFQDDGPDLSGLSVTGWGECSALPAATYTGESAAGSFDALAKRLAPRLIGRTVEPRTVVPTLFGDGPVELPMATSALEMAVLDASLRAGGHSLAWWLGVERSAVSAGATIGLASVTETVATAIRLADAGYRRLKVKVQQGHDREPVAAIRAALPEIELHVDGNGVYGADELGHVVAIAADGIDAFEQPFAPADQRATIELIERIGGRSDGPARGRPVAVVADEAVESMADATRLVAERAMTGLSIKPARVGGIVAAAALHRLCLENGLAATAGGMLESGLGRHGLAALAGLNGFTLIGDLSPSGRWLAADPWPDLNLDDGRIGIHQGPGIAPEPDLDLLEHHTVERRRVPASGGRISPGDR